MAKAYIERFLMSRTHAIYAQYQNETSVASATPPQLVAIVYQRLLDHLYAAKVQLAEQSDTTESLTKAINLISTGLESSLDKEKGGRIAQNLSLIYGWSINEIVRARITRDPEMIQDVINVFAPLAEGWRELAGYKDGSFFAINE